MALVFCSIAVTLIVIELGLRLYLQRFGDDRQKSHYLYTLEEIRQNVRLLRGLAYLNYGLEPQHDEVNEQGYRGPAIALPKPPGTFRIVALGGSTTYGLFLDTWRHAYPGQLQQLLRQEYGHEHVEVINAGAPAYSSFESAVNMLLRISDLEPDMVVIYHGINDVGERMSDPAHYDGLNSTKGYWYERWEPLPNSVIVRYVASKLGHDFKIPFELTSLFRPPEGTRDCQPQHGEDGTFCLGFDMSAREVLADNPPVYFERNLRNMVLLARAMDSQVLLLTWAYSPLDFPIEGGGGMVHGYLQEGVDEQNDILRQIAQDTGTLFYDLAATFPSGQEYWVNGIHMRLQGTAEMARQLASYLDAHADLSPQASP